MGKTHSKPLAARQGKAWAWHAMCESAFRISRLYAAEVVKLATLVKRPPVTVGHTLRNRQTPVELYVTITS
jgi:hypothetical protein